MLNLRYFMLQKMGVTGLRLRSTANATIPSCSGRDFQQRVQAARVLSASIPAGPGSLLGKTLADQVGDTFKPLTRLRAGGRPMMYPVPVPAPLVWGR